MFKNYLKIAIRNFWKGKLYTFINVFGLAMGISCCILILLYVYDELNYESFHHKADRIYRINNETFLGGRTQHWKYSPGPMGPAFETAFPEVEHAVRFAATSVVISYHDRYFSERRFYHVDSNVFNVFSFRFVKGDPATAFANPNSLVLTQAMSEKYFGNKEPLGSSLTIDHDKIYTVTGVIEDLPHNTHLQFDFLASYTSREVSWDSWYAHNQFTYVLLTDAGAAERLAPKLASFVKQKTDKDVWFTPYLQPLGDVHLNRLGLGVKSDGDVRNIYIFSIIAFFILSIACINYMNIATARSAQRAKEVGVKKVVGARRRQIVMQFLFETVILSLTAMAIAIAFTESILPVFNNFVEKDLVFTSIGNLPMIMALIAGALGIGLLAGSYPGLFLSRFKPIAIIRERSDMSLSGSGFRKILVILQFTFSVILIIATTIVYEQMSFIQNKELGFDKDQVLVVRLPDTSVRQQIEVLKTEFMKNRDVISIAASSTVPGRGIAKNLVWEMDEKDGLMMPVISIDDEFLKTLDIKVTEGRSLSSDFATDETGGFMVNETAVEFFGWRSALEKKLNRSGQEGKIVGIVQDFHFASLHNKIEPLIFYMEPAHYSLLSVKINKRNLAGTVEDIENSWKKIAPAQPFEFFFLDENFDKLYRSEQKFGQIIGAFAFLAIMIACLGLFGLAAFAAERRTKEIGIRKVLGASVSGMVNLLSKDFIKLVLVANLVAWPIAWLVMNKWLQEFSYRIEIGLWTFALAGGMALLIALTTVSTLAIRAAKANPVESLRYE